MNSNLTALGMSCFNIQYFNIHYIYELFQYIIYNSCVKENVTLRTKIQNKCVDDKKK